MMLPASQSTSEAPWVITVIRSLVRPTLTIGLTLMWWELLRGFTLGDWPPERLTTYGMAMRLQFVLVLMALIFWFGDKAIPSMVKIIEAFFNGKNRKDK